MKVLVAEPLGVLVHREEVHAARRGRRPRSSARGRRPGCPPRSPAGACRGSARSSPWPCRACRSRRAAGRSRATFAGTMTWKPASSSTSTAALAVCGWKWLLNVSGQRMTRRPADVPRRPPRPPGLERLGGERRHLPPRRDPAQHLEHLADDRRVRDEVDQPGHPARRAAPTSRSGPSRRRAGAAAAPRSSARGTRPCRWPCRRSSGTRSCIPCRPGRGRAPRLTGLVLPAALHRVALEHLEEQVGAAPGRVHLLLGDHVAGAHRPRVLLAALADADAALGRVGEAAVVVGELEVRLDLGRVVGRAEPEVLARQIRGRPPCAGSSCCRVPDRLELAEGPDQLGPEHLGQERRLRLAVAVLARDRAAVADDQVGRLVQELAEVLDALGVFRSKSIRVWMQPWPKWP